MRNEEYGDDPEDEVERNAELREIAEAVAAGTVDHRVGLIAKGGREAGGYGEGDGNKEWTRIDAETNRIFIDEEEGCLERTMRVESVNWVSKKRPSESFEAEVQIRYRDPGKPAYLSPQDDGSLLVEFIEPAWAITPGQSAVFYQDDLLIGGGIIASTSI